MLGAGAGGRGGALRAGEHGAQAGGGAASTSLLLLVFCSCLLLTAVTACGSDPVDLPQDRAAGGESAAPPSEAAPAEPAYPGEEPAPALAEDEGSTAAAPAAPDAGPETPPPADAVRVYLVDLEAGAAGDGGEPAADSFGCGDRLRAVEVPVASEGLDTADRIAAALGALLGAADPPPEGLYDVFAKSELSVESVEAVAGVPGVFRVHLAGDLVLGGVCDHPRVRAQLEATARQFPGVEEVEILLAGRPLDAHLTGRG